MDNNLFRKEALAEINSPDELDRAIRITTRKTHLLVMSLIFIVVALILWGFYGSIPITIQGNGIIMPEGGIHYIIPQKQGIIRDMVVKSGDYIRIGDIVGNLEITDDLGSKRLVQLESTVNGRITEVRSLPGDFVHMDEKIISVVQVDEDLEIIKAVIFVPAEHGKNIIPGLAVHVQPSNVNKEEYGYIKGIVQQVSTYPVSAQRMLSLLGVEMLVSRFSSNQVVLEVEVDLIESTKTVSNFQWSTLKGPPFKIYEGTLCDADFILETKKPISIVIPSI